MSFQRLKQCAAAVAIAGFALAGTAAASGARPLKVRGAETERAGIKIALYEKYNPSEEKNWKNNGKVILLVHGATWSAHCTFDPMDGYSLMDTLAEQGYDVWALDLHGYGRSGKSTRDWTESAAAALDVDAAADYIRALRWVERIHVLGYQWGGWPAGLFAIAHPNKVAKLVFFGMRYKQGEKLAAPQAPYRQNSVASATMHPEDGDLDPDFVRRRAQLCLQSDPRSPNGALLDLTQASPVAPDKIKNAVLMIMGERDGEANTLADRLEFFRALGSHTKWFTVLAGLGKYASFERGRARFESALIGFLDQP